MTDDEPNELERKDIEIRRKDHQIDMLLAALFRELARSLELGNVDSALQSLRGLHEFYKQRADH
jgi:hypothetical protein